MQRSEALAVTVTASFGLRSMLSHSAASAGTWEWKAKKRGLHIMSQFVWVELVGRGKGNVSLPILTTPRWTACKLRSIKYTSPWMVSRDKCFSTAVGCFLPLPAVGQLGRNCRLRWWAGVSAAWRGLWCHRFFLAASITAGARAFWAVFLQGNHKVISGFDQSFLFWVSQSVLPTVPWPLHQPVFSRYW